MTAGDAGMVPRLRFPEFAGAWVEKRLGEAISSANAGTSVNSEDRPKVAGEVAVLKTSCVTNGFFNASENKVVTDTFQQSRLTVPVLEDSIIVSRMNTPQLVGANAIVQQSDPDLFLPDRLWSLQTQKSYSAKWLASLLGSDVMRAKLSELATGTSGSMKNLSKSDLLTMPTAFPNLPEQQKIAAFLAAVDGRLAGLRRRRELLGAYKRGAMQQIFTQTLRFKQDDGTDFPDWEERRLGDVFGWVRTNSLSREFLTIEGPGVQNIHYGDIHTKFQANFRQSAETVPYISSSAPVGDIAEDDFCQAGDVIIADASEDYADIGKAIEIVEVEPNSLVAGLHTYIARPIDRKQIVVGFAGYMLRSAAMRRQIMRIAQGISVLGISKTNLEKLVLQLPHPDEQQKIANFLTALDTKIAAISNQITQTEAFKKGLLQQMFV